jgi:hypothetical protein
MSLLTPDDGVGRSGRQADDCETAPKVTFRWKGGGGYVIRFDDIPDMAARFLYALMKWCPQRIFGVSCSASGKKSQE